MAKVVNVTVEGRTYSIEDLTLAEANAIDQATGETWGWRNPLSSPTKAVTILELLLARTLGKEEAKAKAEAMTITEAFDAFDVVDDDLPDTFVDGIPKAEDAPTTPS